MSDGDSYYHHESLEQKLQLVNGQWTARHPETGKLLSGAELFKAARDGVFDWMSTRPFPGYPREDTWKVRIDSIQSIMGPREDGLQQKYQLNGAPIQLIYEDELDIQEAGDGTKYNHKESGDRPYNQDERRWLTKTSEGRTFEAERNLMEHESGWGKYAYFVTGKKTKKKCGCLWKKKWNVTEDYSVKNMANLISE